MGSSVVKDGFERAPHRSLLYATGKVKCREDFSKPFIGVCNSFVEIIPGHVHLDEFGDGTSYGSGDAGVTDNGDGSFDYAFTNVTENHTIQATFDLDIDGWEVIAKSSALGRISPTSASGKLLYDTGANQTFKLTPKSATFPPDMSGVFSKLEVIKEADYPGTWTEYTSADAEITDLGDGQYSFTLTNITESWRLFARFTT